MSRIKPDDSTVKFKVLRLTNRLTTVRESAIFIIVFTIFLAAIPAVQAVSVPIASFTVNATYGSEYAAFKFTDTSLNAPASWTWTYINKTPGNNTEIRFSTSQNPTMSFGAGNWTIKLNATNSAGSHKTTGTTIKVLSIAGIQLLPSDNIFYSRVDTLPVDPHSSTWINNGVNRPGQDFALHWSDDSASYNVIDGTLGITGQNVTNLKYLSDNIKYPIPSPVKMPPPPPANTDQNMFIINKDNLTLYWLYHAYWNSATSSYDAYSASYFLNDNTIKPYKGFPYIAMDIKYSEVMAGSVNHVVEANTRHTNKSSVWPWTGYYESYTDGTYPPLGQRFRLKSSVDISGFSPQAKTIAQALKTYGLIVDNQHGSENVGFELYVVPDQRWSSDGYTGTTGFEDLRRLHMTDFEAVNTNGLMVSSGSMQAR